MGPMRILLADDEPLSRELVLRTLRARTPHDVTAVEDGEQALELSLREPCPDVLLLDWMMPGLSGLEVCARVRKASLRVQPYIILITARNSREDMLEGLGAGADDFLSKPTAPDILVARLLPAARRSGAGRSHSRAVAQALFRARDEGDGELVVTDGAINARVLFHRRQVAWAHVSDDRNTLLEILTPEAGIDADMVREVVAECRRTGARLSDTLVSFGLVDRARLRDQLLDWTRRKMQSILRFERPQILFLPQKRGYSEDLLFDLEELLGDEAQLSRARSAYPPAAPSSQPPWQGAFSDSDGAAPRAELTRVLDRALLGDGVLGAAIIDRLTGVCLLQRGQELSPDVAWAHLQSLNVLSRQERVLDSIVVTDRYFHLVCFVPEAPDCFVYILADAKKVLLAAARHALQQAVSS
ncbi:MAG: response regulator transcription factor [Myxococcales bacterium]|nr:MAG: response regulator transcription factor [Myxococcales bacterium]